MPLLIMIANADATKKWISQRMTLWMASSVAIIVILAVCLTIWLQPSEKQSITLKDGLIFSFEGVSKIREPFYFEDSTFSGSAIWIRLVKSVPKLSPFIKKMGLIPPSRRLKIGLAKPDDIAFWISTTSANGMSHGNISESLTSLNINGIDIEIQDAATGETLRTNGSGGGNVDANTNISHFSVPLSGKEIDKIHVILREKDEMGILQEKAVWEVILP